MATYGILITTTPGYLLTAEGQSANFTRTQATPFSEHYYDMTLNELTEMMQINKNSSFVYMRFTYQQLGSGEAYFNEMVKQLERDWGAIMGHPTRIAILVFLLTQENC